jgi:hypothetical protein
MSASNPQMESRALTRERRSLEQAMTESRSKYYGYVAGANNHAIRWTFTKNHADKINERITNLRSKNPDESRASVSIWTWSLIILLALIAVVAIDYLIMGGTLDYLLTTQRELQGVEEYFVYLKVLGTVALLTVEVAIAIGLVLLRERSNSIMSVFLHWFIGIGLALALSAFAFGLMYTKIKNESLNIPVFDSTAPALGQVSETDQAETPIPPQKKVLLVGLCGICFFIHIFALMKADSVADAFALVGYGLNQTLLSTGEKFHRFRTNRAAARTENLYRQAYDQFEEHNAAFPNDQLPSVRSQQNPNQLIPVMRLSPIAQRIIESLQNGVVEDMNTANQNGHGQPAETAELSSEPIGDGGPPEANPGNPNQNAEADYEMNVNNHDAHRAGNNGSNVINGNEPQAQYAAEADYLRTVLDAHVRNSDSGI